LAQDTHAEAVELGGSCRVGVQASHARRRVGVPVLLIVGWVPAGPMENVWAEGDSRLVHKVGASEKWRHGAAVRKKNLQDWDKLVHATFRQIRPSFYVNAVNGMNARIANMVQRKGARVPK